MKKLIVEWRNISNGQWEVLEFRRFRFFQLKKYLNNRIQICQRNIIK